MLINATILFIQAKTLKMQNFILNVNSQEEKVLGITIDIALLFDSLIKENCKKAFQKLAALSR